jgi:DNA-binding transcriptional LysR family regulator
LRLLEEEMAVALFDRRRRGVELTAAGRQMLVHARRVLDEVAKAKAEVTPTAGSVSGIVAIGLLASTAELLSASLVSSVAKRYPGIRLRVLVGYDGQLLDWLENFEIDAALLYEQTPTQAQHLRRLVQVDLWAVGPAKAGLKRGKPLSLSKVASQPFVFPSAPHGVRTLTEQTAADRGLDFRVVAETNSLNVQKQLVAAGLGWTILPAIAVLTETESGILSAAPLDEPAFTRRIVLAEGAKRSSVALQCTVDTLIECMRLSVQRKHWTGALWIDKGESGISQLRRKP